MQRLLSNGRATVVPKSKPPREPSASSEDDPDLCMWEMLFFGLVDERKMGSLQGFIEDPKQWGRRMKARGFASPVHAKEYPTFEQQKLAEREDLRKRWGKADIKDGQLWTDKSGKKGASTPKFGTVKSNEKPCRKFGTAKPTTGVASTQTGKMPLSRGNHAATQARGKDGKFRPTGRVPAARQAWVKAHKEKSKTSPLRVLSRTLQTAEKELNKLKRQAEKFKEGAQRKRTRS